MTIARAGVDLPAHFFTRLFAHGTHLPTRGALDSGRPGGAHPRSGSSARLRLWCPGPEPLPDRALHDYGRGLSVTHMLYVKGIAAAYVTLMTDRIKLGTREKPKGVTYQFVPAVKIAQLAVATRFSGHGLGSFMVAYAVEHARTLREIVGCRYVTLDAQPHLIGWYEGMGFRRNIEEQRYRVQLAAERNRPAGDLPVSMRFDLRDVRDHV